MKKNYGWKRDLPDKRDLVYGAQATTLPETVDLSKGMAAVYNQGNLGSCTAQGLAAIYQFTFRENKNKNFMPSRLKVYYDERVLEGTVKYDSGAMLRTGMKVLVKNGVCAEALWGYSDDAKTFKKKPPVKCYKAAVQHKALKYYKVTQTIQNICLALASEDPVVFGFALYESFESASVAKTGIVPMPNFYMESCLGGHAVVLVGYDKSKKIFKVRNSWGDWGDKGYFYMPFDYVADYSLAADFWALKVVK
jgi:C1A family cysteine protease